MNPLPVIPGHEILRPAGSGASGLVYEARRASDGARVAVKVLRAGEQEDFIRFSAEYRALLSLDHPALVRVHDFGRMDDGRWYFAMDWVEGAPVHAAAFRDADGAPDARRLAEFVFDVTAALEAVHRQGILHGDLKPDNLLLTADGTVKVMDFGLHNRGTAEDGGLSGTLAYLAPERIRREPATAGADLYALGCVLFELISGAPPFAGDTPLDVLRAHLQEAPPPLEHVPDAIRGWVAQLLEKDPRRRYRTAFQLHAAAAAYLGRPAAFSADGEVAPLCLPELPRSAEAARAREEAAAAREGARALILRGVPGAGITRFLRALGADLQIGGARVLRDACRAGDTPFAPVLRLVRAAWPDGAEIPPDADAALQTLRGLSLGADASAPADDPPAQLALFHAAATLLAGGTCDAIVIDDADAADAMTEDFLAYFLSWLHAHERRGLFVVLGWHSGDSGERGCPLETSPRATTLTLPPLSRQEVESVLGTLLGSVTPSFAHVLHRQSGGSPGRLEELLAFCRSEGIVEQTPHGWLVHERENLGSVFPASQQQLVASRVARLDAGLRRVALLLAAAPGPVSTDTLDAVASDTGIDAVTRAAACARLAAEGIAMRAGQDWTCAHALYRTLLDTGGPDARAVHDAYFRRYELVPPESDADAVRAHHALRGSEPARALPFLLRAAETRERLHDHAAAWELRSRALPLVPAADADLRFRTLASLARLCHNLGKRGDEEEHLEEMLVLAAQSQAPQRLAEVYLLQSAYHAALGEHERGRRSAEKALAAYTEAGDRLGRARAHHRIGQALYRTHPGPEVIAQYEQARALYAESGAEADEGGILVDIGLAHYSLLRDPDAALARFDEARVLFTRIGDARGLTRAHGNAGAQLYALGRYAEALEQHTHANALARDSGDRRLIGISCGAMGQCELALCRYSPALLHLEEELRIARELDDRHMEELCLENLGELHLTLGMLDEAARSYGAAMERAVAGGNAVGEAAGCIDLAGVHLERRETDKAQKLLRRARQLLDENEDVNVRAMLHYRTGMLHLAEGPDGDPAHALEEFGRLGDLADAQGFASFRVLARSYAAVAQLRLGRIDAARALSDDAVDLLGSAGPLYGGTHDVFYNHALVLRAARDAGGADAAMERAHAGLMACAASIAEPALYRSYLEQVRINAQIVRDHALAHRDSSPHALSAVREHNLRTLYDVAGALTSTLELAPLLDAIMDRALEAMQGERGMIFLVENGQLVLKVSRNVEKETIEDATEISLSALRNAWQDGRPVIVSDAATDERFRARDSVVNFRIRSLMCVPIISRAETLGTVYVDSRADALTAIHFSDTDADFLQAFAHLAAIAIENARLHASLREENVQLRRAIDRRFGFESIVGSSAPMDRLFAETQAAIQGDSSVLIYGESGTGKELIAKAIHFNGRRRDRRFVAVDCGALPDTLLESELFGYKRGAFTGAVGDKPGLFEEAHEGTLFLDEISNTSLAFQAKLLRVLQEGEFRRVGDTKTRVADVRVICATNRDLDEEIRAGRFRQDLFYRLNVIPITVPPLRDRTADIPDLVQHFVARNNERAATAIRGASDDLLDHLARLPWKGNVRELENLIHRMMARCNEDVLTTRMLPAEYAGSPGAAERADGGVELSLRPQQRMRTLVDVEKEHIAWVLQQCGGNKTEAARILGLKRTTLVERMKKLGMM